MKTIGSITYKKRAAAKYKPLCDQTQQIVIVRDTVVHVVTERGKRETEREKTRATINSTLVMRGEEERPQRD